MKPIDLEKLKQSFKLVDGVLYKYYEKNGPHFINNPEWRPVVNEDSKGYNTVYFDSYQYLAHRIVWALANNQDTDLEIDHIDGNIHNNHPSNLRAVDKRTNSNNKQSHRDGKLPGSYLDVRGYYCSTIKIKGKDVYLGRYTSEIEANEVYQTAVNNLDRYDGDSHNFREYLRSIGCSIPKVLGCSYKPAEDKWQTILQVNGERFSLGYYLTEQQASEVYDKAVELRHLFVNKEQFTKLVKSHFDIKPNLRTKSKGCSYDKTRDRWAVQFQVGSIKMSLGTYRSQDEAVNVYKRADSLRNQFQDKEQFKKLVLSRE